MKGSITKIHNPKPSRNGNVFIRIEFKMEDGKWRKTDICPSYRNYQRWKSLLSVGIDLSGLLLKGKDAVDADSFPQKIKPEIEGRYVELPNGNMKFVSAQDVIDEADSKIAEAEEEAGSTQETLI